MTDNPSYHGGQGQDRPGGDYYDPRYGRPQDDPRAAQDPRGPYPPEQDPYGQGQGGYPPAPRPQGGYGDQGGYPSPYGQQQGQGGGYGAQNPYDQGYPQQPQGGYGAGQPGYGDYGQQPGRHEEPGQPQGGGYDYGQPQGQGGYDYNQPQGGGYDYNQPQGGGYDAPPAQGGYDYGQAQGQGGYGGGYGAATVTLQLDDGSGRTYQLQEGSNVIGRGQDAQFRLPDTGVSRRHLDIRWDGRVALLSDLNSTNGTTVNNAPVQEWQLADGDVVRVGHSEIIVRVH